MLSRATKVFTFLLGLPRNVNVLSAFQHFHKSSSEFFIFPSVNKRIADGVQASRHVVNDKLVRPTFWMATLGQLPEKAKACHHQQRYDTEKAYCYHHGESAVRFHFMLDSMR